MYDSHVIMAQLHAGYTIKYPNKSERETYIQKHPDGYVLSTEEPNKGGDNPIVTRKLIDESSLMLLIELACNA